MPSYGQTFPAIGQVDMYIDVPNGATSNKVLLRNALHAPDMAFTVVSIGRITKASYLVEFDDPSWNIKRKSEVFIIDSIPASSSVLFTVHCQSRTHPYSGYASGNVRRLGHVGPSIILS